MKYALWFLNDDAKHSSSSANKTCRADGSEETRGSVFLQNDNKKLLPISISTDAVFPMCFVPSNCLGFARRIFHADNKQQHKTTFHPEKTISRISFHNSSWLGCMQVMFLVICSRLLVFYGAVKAVCECGTILRAAERWKSVPISITIKFSCSW